MSRDAPNTVSLQRSTAAPGDERAPQLVVLFACDHPLAGSSRHLLAGVDQVVLGRGAARRVRRDGRVLEISLPDPAMSSRHARLTRVTAEAWVLEDDDSKNGCYQNGLAVRRARLQDGDLIELGQTLLLFRDGVPPVRPSEPDLDATEAPRLGGELPTFAAALATPYEALEALAPTTVPVLVLGDTGTGKELVARALHAASRRPGAFATLNCGAIPKDLVEATLFGHRRGAFSGAVDDRPGIVRSAEKGTLFLDEIGDLPLASQVAFLRVLQEQEVTPVGDARPMKVDFRLVAATHARPSEQAAAGAFRADLLARVAGYTVTLPPLVERREDLGILVPVLLRRIAGPDAERMVFAGAAARALVAYAWPLNLRELESTLRVAVALAGAQGRIELEHLPAPLQAAGREAGPGAPEVDDTETLRAELIALLSQHRGNVSEVARAMGKGRMQIHRWLRKLALDPDAYRR